MPWSPSQHRLFEGVAHGDIKPKGDLSKGEASKLASEGVKGSEKKKRRGMGQVKRATVRGYNG